MMHNKDEKIKSFFLKNVDRLFVINELFPAIGTYLKEQSKKDILNIGIEKYNIYDREFFKNDNINFYGLDKNDKPYLPKNWKHIYKIDLTSNLPKNIKKFDVIIDYGVIGWPGVNTYLNHEQISKYIKNISLMLEPHGLYFLKLDYKYTNTVNPQLYYSNKLILEIVSHFFIPTDFYDLSKKKLIQNDDIYYDTFVFKLRSKSNLTEIE